MHYDIPHAMLLGLSVFVGSQLFDTVNMDTGVEYVLGTTIALGCDIVLQTQLSFLLFPLKVVKKMKGKIPRKDELGKYIDSDFWDKCVFIGNYLNLYYNVGTS